MREQTKLKQLWFEQECKKKKLKKEQQNERERMRIINIKAKSYRIMAQTMVEAHEAQGFDLPDVEHIGEKI